MLFMLLLTTRFYKNSHILAGTFFIFLKNVLKQYENSMKGLRVAKNVNGIEFEGGLGRVKIKKSFPETIAHKIFETSSSFHGSGWGGARQGGFSFCFS